MSRAGPLGPVDIVGPASRLPKSERAGFVERACRGDGALRAEVESLLAALSSGDDFMERGPLSGPIVRPELVPEVLAPGTLVSRYRVERVLGEGGMGVVYLAQQENPRREVALKVVRAAVASPSLLRRFQREAQVMGRLQHPGIVQIFEAGAAEVGGSRQPFVAMEYVRGMPLSRHVLERGLSVRQRLEIVAQVCDAVQHAHERGLVHRDLKPQNVLVDESGRAKVLDFGVARAAELDGPGTTVATDVGQLIGTLAYMSPEQVGADPTRVDARSDVYALGVLLYEILAGRPPHVVRLDAVPEAVRAIQQDAPARLSSIHRVLRGDVETIVGKAMEKDAARRYQSAAELGADIRRYLAGEPIAAKQDSALYILQKRVRRYRWAFAAGALFVVMIAGFAARSVMQAGAMRELALKEHAASEAAQAAADRARRAERARTLELRESDIERGLLLSRTGDAGQAESLLWRALAQDPSSERSRWALREHYANAPCLSTFKVESKVVRAISFDPAGRRVCVNGWEGCTHVWDVGQGRLIDTFDGAKSALSAAFTPGGWLVAGQRSGPITVWDPRTALKVGELNSPGTEVYLAVSPDGLFAASGGLDGTVTIWSLPQFASLGSFRAHEGGTAALAFSPDGRMLATGGRDKIARVWDLATRAELAHTEPLSGSVTDLVFSRDGQRLACGSSNWVARVWDLRDGTLRPVADDIGKVRTVAFLRSDTLIAALGEWGISLYDARTLAYQRDLGNHGEPVTRIKASPDGSMLLSLSRDSVLKLWEFAPDGPATWLCSERGHAHGELNMGAPSADGSMIATASSSGGVELWRGDGEFIRYLPGPGRMGQYDVSFNAAGTLVAGAANDGVVRVWPVDGSGPARELRGHKGVVNCVKFAPSGDLLASCGDDGKARLWDAATGKCLRTLNFGNSRLHRVRFGASGELVLASGAKDVGIWETRTGKRRPGLPLGEASDIFSLEVSPDGSMVAVSYRRRAIGLFDLSTNRHIADLTGHTELPWNMAFSPDGKLLLSSTSAGSLKLWDLPSRRCVASFRDDSSGWLMTVSFIAGSSNAVLSHQFRGVSIWDLSYYDRHIAGNAEAQLAKLGAELGEESVAATKAWIRTLRR